MSLNCKQTIPMEKGSTQPKKQQHQVKLKVFGVGGDTALENKAAREGGHAPRTGYRRETIMEQPNRFLLRAKPPSIQSNQPDTKEAAPKARCKLQREALTEAITHPVFQHLSNLLCSPALHAITCRLRAAPTHLWPPWKVEDITSKPAALGTPAWQTRSLPSRFSS